jgi:hypothetical protein
MNVKRPWKENDNLGLIDHNDWLAIDYIDWPTCNIYMFLKCILSHIYCLSTRGAKF